jgi:hypothetical protein
MQKRVLASLFAVMALNLVLQTATMASDSTTTSTYPPRPSSARVQYEMWYFPVRVVSMLTTVIWDVPTGAFQDGIKGSIGFTKMVARNLGKEDGTYEMIAGGLVGGPVGLVEGSAYGLLHGFGYGVNHGFVGYPSPYSGSHSMLFQGVAYRVPYDDNY